MNRLPFDDAAGPPAPPPPADDLSLPGWGAPDPFIVAGNATEAEAVRLLDEAGWESAPFGIQALPAAMRRAIAKRTPPTLIRALPDLAVRRRHDDLAWLAEVKGGRGDTPYVAIEYESLAICKALRALWNIPVVIISLCDDQPPMAAHVEDLTVHDLRPEGSKRGTGSPFVRIPRADFVTFALLFGGPDSMHAKAPR